MISEIGVPSRPAGAGRPPSLSVVIPVFNEPEWIRRSVASVTVALDASTWDSPEVILVDDGSTDGTGEVLDAMAREDSRLRVIHQLNQGRFVARHSGLAAAQGDYVLFVDSRVELDPGSLEYLSGHLGGDACVWNGHLVVNTRGNPFALFWDALPKIAWSDYLGNPRTTSFGVDDFDRYPKGSGCFAAPREVLLDGYRRFSTRYADIRNASDDTSLIRGIAELHRIWISPGFSCRYQARSSIAKFVPHVFQRGVFFVDGHLRGGARFAPVVVAFYPVSLGVLVFTAWWPPAPVAALAVASLAAAGFGAAKHLPRAHLAALAAITPLFAVTYGLGMWKGLALVLRNRARRSLWSA